MSWTQEKVNKLKELWGKGSTASQIAEIIGGVSRNAVIGKAHRLNLSQKIKTRSSVHQAKTITKQKRNNIFFIKQIPRSEYLFKHKLDLTDQNNKYNFFLAALAIRIITK